MRVGRIKPILYDCYVLMLAIYLVFIIVAFCIENPAEIWNGMIRIITLRDILMTDYIAVGGLGATLVNSAVTGIFSVLMLVLAGVKPTGATIMALWLTTGFAFFGKNISNMIPLTFGVWLFSRYEREPFINYSLAALLVATLSPTVSFFRLNNLPLEIIAGIILGFLAGFLFPSISAGSVRVHLGYNLYSMGFAAGLICTVFASVLLSMGIDISSHEILSSGNNLGISIGLYAISCLLLIYGLVRGNIRETLKGFRAIFKHSGRLVSDFYFEYRNSVYVNMAVLCAFSTTVALVLGAELNGPVIAGILTVTGFGSFGKHLRNISPVMLGAILTVFLFGWDIGSSKYIIVILFSTGLAPIAGQYGWLWGMLAGFLHVNIAAHTSYLGGGMNLYNNGFAAGFVAMFLLPLITMLRKEENK
ncbi:MAG: DUF1576 domain-containing protein [Oscillospiraceae bacterium]|nr:DUF1576 domain-containing protein [Oscillospiraceae bacterium]